MYEKGVTTNSELANLVLQENGAKIYVNIYLSIINKKISKLMYQLN